ncbi:hypothetical protein DAPPUDRAFT_259407 [Daphnia pulex]|uniref:Uncharacterized protein n=1 Tax=Daphnia pulex TaxID=6669 RepID=E9HH71_DAPPU|nr:hypothetical protein DAPPUDRAFT_259407 [Daphnia pulex]|eukprot:EFX68888.1 hypothetical protein DAPPUDRAFT_259407 [Daphnia pulex]
MAAPREKANKNKGDKMATSTQLQREITQNIPTEIWTTKEQVTRALVLRPTEEFCQQLQKAFLPFITNSSRALNMRYLTTNYRSVLTSATLGDDIQSLKQLVLRQPVTLRLEESE